MQKTFLGAIGILFAFIILIASSLTRIETGEVGIRIGFDKQIQQTELLPGSFNQTIIGSVLKVPVKDVNAKIENIPVLSKDNSTMKDFDMSVIYSLNPSQVTELYSKKSKGFNAQSDDGDLLLMYNWITQTVRNVAYTAAREHEALAMNDSRASIEQEIMKKVNDILIAEKLDNAITITQIQVRSIQPADDIVRSANELVKAKNDLARKNVEVQTALAEARRIDALNASKGAVEYMDAESRKLIAQGVANCKANVVVPLDFKGIVKAGN